MLKTLLLSILPAAFLTVLFFACGRADQKNQNEKPDSSSDRTSGLPDTILDEPKGFIPDCYSEMELRNLPDSGLHAILKDISKIREVRSFYKENDDTLTYCIMPENEISDSLYTIRVGLDQPTHFSTRFLFKVNKYNSEIKVLEILSGSMMTLKEWRKSAGYKSLYY